jgi:hypothetical protein
VTDFLVQGGDVIKVPSDLLLLKFAQNFYGADEAVASRLVGRGVCSQAELRPAPGDFVAIETKGAIAPKRVLFLGTPPLRSFKYSEMQVFARRAIEKIVDLRLPVRILTTTVHGTGYGLDGGEALQRLVRGFRDGLSVYRSTGIQRITFLTIREREERMLRAALQSATIGDVDPSAGATEVGRTGRTHVRAMKPPGKPSDAQSASARFSVSPEIPVVRKRRVFVALPFSEEFQNVYEFGIYPAVRNCGMICERVDETHFTGDILARIRDGIEAAAFVVADLTEGRPNVYLEVGYAWGRGVPVIFVAKRGEKLHFDVATHRCIFYGKFTQFARELEELIRGIEATPTGRSDGSE